MRWPIHKNDGRCPSKEDPGARDFSCRACDLMEELDRLFDSLDSLEVDGDLDSEPYVDLAFHFARIRRIAP